MLDPDVRKAIYQSHLVGMPQREISRRFRISRDTVGKIIRQQGVMPQTVRKDKIQIDPDLVQRLFRECDGWAQRVQERLVEEHGVQIHYSTLTRLLRELNLSQPASTRCDRVPDEPGAEMQHDTSPYRVRLAGILTPLIASLLYLRYSKVRYLKFYPVFNRFLMKCFLHEALLFWGYSAKLCIIDNTNLARLRGVGRQAIIVPEMATFAQRYGFEFICHELGHSNRKAGEERSFWTVESNFLPGRHFESLEDLNRQAFEWATVRMYHRPLSKTRLIPAKAIEHERQFLTQLSEHLPAPYQTLNRDIDQYGYVSFQANYYWVPGHSRCQVKLLQYANCIKIFLQRQCVIDYPLPPDGVKNERFSPPGQPQPRHQPKYRKHGTQHEQQRLRAIAPQVASYVDYILETKGIQPHRLLRQLLALSQKITPGVFVQTAERALRYRIVDFTTIERIAWLCMSQEGHSLPAVEVDENYRQRPAYQEGYLTDHPDLSIYDALPANVEASEEHDTNEEGDL